MQYKLVEKAATDPGVPFEPEILAQITDLRRKSQADYERLRDQLKQNTGVRVSELDKATKVLEATAENDSSTFLDPPDPWPHPVDGGALLDGIAKIFNDHMVLPKGAEDMLALWVLHAHAHKSAGISPTQATRSLPLTLVTVEDFEAGFIFSLFKFHPDPGKGVFNLFVC